MAITKRVIQQYSNLKIYAIVFSVRKLSKNVCAWRNTLKRHREHRATKKCPQNEKALVCLPALVSCSKKKTKKTAILRRAHTSASQQCAEMSARPCAFQTSIFCRTCLFLNTVTKAGRTVCLLHRLTLWNSTEVKSVAQLFKLFKAKLTPKCNLGFLWMYPSRIRRSILLSWQDGGCTDVWLLLTVPSISE